MRDRETKCRTTLICHACGWVHWIYGHCIFEHICYVPCANHTHSTAHCIFGHWTFEWHCVSFCIWWECRCACRYLCINSPFVYGMYTCVCMCTGKLLHFNAKMLSIHHSNFNYIIQMGLQRFTKKQQQTFRYIRLHHRRSEIAFAHSMKIEAFMLTGFLGFIHNQFICRFCHFSFHKCLLIYLVCIVHIKNMGAHTDIGIANSI